MKYTFDLVLDPKAPRSGGPTSTRSNRVDVVDRKTVRFHTMTPFPPLLGAFAILRSSAILKSHLELVKLDAALFAP